MGSIHARQSQIRSTFGTASPPEKTVSDHMASLTTPRRIVSGMKFFPDSVVVQRAGAKQLSNLSFNVQNVPSVLQRGGLKRLVKSLKSHGQDWKLCWFGASAIWNLARPADARQEVGTAVELLIGMLRRHQKREQVAHTVLGALSNLALEEQNVGRIVTEETLKLVFETIALHPESCQVMTSSLGLIANLSIQEDIAQRLAEHGAVDCVVRGLMTVADSFPEEDTRVMLVENGMAALSNLTFVEAFPRFFLRAHGVEMLCQVLRNPDEFPLSIEEDMPLIGNILEAVGLTRQLIAELELNEDDSREFYSLHQAVALVDEPGMQMAGVVRELLLDPEEEMLLNTQDGQGHTPLDYAVALEAVDMITMLITSGARVSADARATAAELDMADVVEAAEGDYEAMVYATAHTIDSATGMHPDICGVVVDYLSKYELSKSVLEPLKGRVFARGYL